MKSTTRRTGRRPQSGNRYLSSGRPTFTSMTKRTGAEGGPALIDFEESRDRGFEYEIYHVSHKPQKEVDRRVKLLQDIHACKTYEEVRRVTGRVANAAINVHLRDRWKKEAEGVDEDDGVDEAAEEGVDGEGGAGEVHAPFTAPIARSRAAVGGAATGAGGRARWAKLFEVLELPKRFPGSLLDPEIQWRRRREGGGLGGDSGGANEGVGGGVVGVDGDDDHHHMHARGGRGSGGVGIGGGVGVVGGGDDRDLVKKHALPPLPKLIQTYHAPNQGHPSENPVHPGSLPVAAGSSTNNGVTTSQHEWNVSVQMKRLVKTLEDGIQSLNFSMNAMRKHRLPDNSYHHSHASSATPSSSTPLPLPTSSNHALKPLLNPPQPPQRNARGPATQGVPGDSTSAIGSGRMKKGCPSSMPVTDAVLQRSRELAAQARLTQTSQSRASGPGASGPGGKGVGGHVPSEDPLRKVTVHDEEGVDESLLAPLSVDIQKLLETREVMDRMKVAMERREAHYEALVTILRVHGGNPDAWASTSKMVVVERAVQTHLDGYRDAAMAIVTAIRSYQTLTADDDIIPPPEQPSASANNATGAKDVASKKVKPVSTKSPFHWDGRNYLDRMKGDAASLEPWGEILLGVFDIAHVSINPFLMARTHLLQCFKEGVVALPKRSLQLLRRLAVEPSRRRAHSDAEDGDEGHEGDGARVTEAAPARDSEKATVVRESKSAAPKAPDTKAVSADSKGVPPDAKGVSRTKEVARKATHSRVQQLRAEADMDQPAQPSDTSGSEKGADGADEPRDGEGEGEKESPGSKGRRTRLRRTSSAMKRSETVKHIIGKRLPSEAEIQAADTDADTVDQPRSTPSPSDSARSTSSTSRRRSRTLATSTASMASSSSTAGGSRVLQIFRLASRRATMMMSLGGGRDGGDESHGESRGESGIGGLMRGVSNGSEGVIESASLAKLNTQTILTHLSSLMTLSRLAKPRTGSNAESADFGGQNRSRAMSSSTTTLGVRSRASLMSMVAARLLNRHDSNTSLLSTTSTASDDHVTSNTRPRSRTSALSSTSSTTTSRYLSASDLPVIAPRHPSNSKGSSATGTPSERGGSARGRSGSGGVDRRKAIEPDRMARSQPVTRIKLARCDSGDLPLLVNNDRSNGYLDADDDPVRSIGFRRDPYRAFVPAPTGKRVKQTLLTGKADDAKKKKKNAASDERDDPEHPSRGRNAQHFSFGGGGGGGGTGASGVSRRGAKGSGAKGSNAAHHSHANPQHPSHEGAVSPSTPQGSEYTDQGVFSVNDPLSPGDAEAVGVEGVVDGAAPSGSLLASLTQKATGISALLHDGSAATTTAQKPAAGGESTGEERAGEREKPRGLVVAPKTGHPAPLDAATLRRFAEAYDALSELITREAEGFCGFGGGYADIYGGVARGAVEEQLSEWILASKLEYLWKLCREWAFRPPATASYDPYVWLSPPSQYFLGRFGILSGADIAFVESASPSVTVTQEIVDILLDPSVSHHDNPWAGFLFGAGVDPIAMARGDDVIDIEAAVDDLMAAVRHSSNDGAVESRSELHGESPSSSSSSDGCSSPESLSEKGDEEERERESDDEGDETVAEVKVYPLHRRVPVDDVIVVTRSDSENEEMERAGERERECGEDDDEGMFEVVEEGESSPDTPLEGDERGGQGVSGRMSALEKSLFRTVTPEDGEREREKEGDGEREGERDGEADELEKEREREREKKRPYYRKRTTSVRQPTLIGSDGAISLTLSPSLSRRSSLRLRSSSTSSASLMAGRRDSPNPAPVTGSVQKVPSTTVEMSKATVRSGKRL